MLMIVRPAILIVAMLAAAPVPAQAAEIDALTSTAIKTVTDALIPPFERQSGNTVHATFAPPGALLKKFETGEPADVFLTGRDAIDKLIGEGKILRGRIDFATTGIAICVRKGAPKPDVSTPDALRRRGDRHAARRLAADYGLFRRHHDSCEAGRRGARADRGTEGALHRADLEGQGA